jgi:hypothetical protein
LIEYFIESDTSLDPKIRCSNRERYRDGVGVKGFFEALYRIILDVI